MSDARHIGQVFVLLAIATGWVGLIAIGAEIWLGALASRSTGVAIGPAVVSMVATPATVALGSFTFLAWTLHLSTRSPHPTLRKTLVASAIAAVTLLIAALTTSMLIFLEDTSRGLLVAGLSAPMGLMFWLLWLACAATYMVAISVMTTKHHTQ